MLHKVNKKAAAVLDFLYQTAKENHGHAKVNNTRPGSAIMPVDIELLPGDKISVSHHYVQFGDLMRDPEIVYWIKNGEYYPCEFIQDGSFARYEELIEFDADGKPSRYMPIAQKDAAEFSGIWMKNITDQQHLSIKSRAARQLTESEKQWRELRKLMRGAK